MNVGIELSAGIEELDLSVRAYKALRANEINTVEDLLKMNMAECWLLICWKSRKCFEEILLRLDEFGLRLFDCSFDDYPYLAKALPGIEQQLDKLKLRNTRISASKRECIRTPSVPVKQESRVIPGAIIQNFASLTAMIKPSGDNGLFLAIADGSNNFRDYGITEGSMLVFDSEQLYQHNFPGCFINKETNALRVMKEKDSRYEYLGKLVAVVNTSWPEAV